MTVPLTIVFRTRNDLAWAISVGGIGIVLFAALLLFAWYFAATLFLIFAGMLLGVALNAMTNVLGRVVRLPHALRLTIVCLALVAHAVGRGLSRRRHHRPAGHRAEQHDQVAAHQRQNFPRKKWHRHQLSSTSATAARQRLRRRRRRRRRRPRTHNLPSAGAIASSGGAIVSQTFKMLLGTVSAVGNFFIVLFLGLAFAAQPGVYRKGLLFMAPAQASRPRHRHRRSHRRDAGALADRADRSPCPRCSSSPGSGLRSSASRARSSLASRPACSPSSRPSARMHRRADRGAGEPRLGMGRGAVSAFVLFLGVHALESYMLTPIIQRQALDIPPATLFAFQILLGVVFGIWGLALALPLMAIAKVMIDHFKAEETPPVAVAA